MSTQIENTTATKKTTKKTTKVVPTAVAEETKAEAAPAVAQETKAVAQETKAVVDETKEEKPKRERKAKASEPRKQVTGESVQKDIDDLLAFFVEQKAAASLDGKATKILNAVKKRLARLRQDISRVVKKSTKSTAPKDPAKVSSSGLMKPVPISERLAQFMGVAAGTPQSRVAVTNALCLYIKTKGLQNPVNKREILPDAELVNLLGYSGEVAATPLTYFYIQQLIQKHFVKQPKA